MNCIIIHGCPSSKEKSLDPETRTYDKHWMPWTKRELEKRGIKTETPLMPEPWTPDYDKFKAEFEKYEVDENSVLIGHSCGTTFLTRWLGESKQRVAKLILVAPWCIADEKSDSARIEYYEHPIDEGIKERVGEIIIFTADDEEEDGKRSAEIFHEKLGGEVVELTDHGHYTMGDMGTEEFPELIEAVISSVD